MKRILIGGSPCTHWSIAQKNNRETTAEGIGWELFKNYLIAKEKFKPDIFLYENNKSAAQAIKDQISIELGVPLQYINSALVSAQNRQRFYAHNIPNVPQPEDRGILLRDILESGTSWKEKSYCLDANYYKATNGTDPFNGRQSGQRLMIAEPITVLNINPSGKGINGAVSQINGKSRCLTTNKGEGQKIIEPVRIGTIENDDGTVNEICQSSRVYSCDGKAVTIRANGGGGGAKTGLYACPVAINTIEGEDKARCLLGRYYKNSPINGLRDGYGGDTMVAEAPTDSSKPIYEVLNGCITIKGKQYPIKLADGYYIIRKLTVTECCRLQTMPDDYCRAVSASQAYKGLGNGWTAEVIIHILKHMRIPLDEEIEVLSMYDGIGTGRYCFDKMGYKNVRYHAYEIDKYAKQVANSNYQDIIQCGDAFQVRNDDWIVR